MRVLPACLFSFLFFINSCQKAEQSGSCKPCSVTGVYAGTFHQTAACYGCVPYIDTIFAGTFVVDTFATDSLRVIRSFDGYEWRVAYNDSGIYYRWACCTTGESLRFSTSDSLYYFYNNGGSGGYWKIEFSGTKQ